MKSGFSESCMERNGERERKSILHAQPSPPLPSLNPPSWVAVCTVQSIRRIVRIERVHGFMGFAEGSALRHAIMIGQLLLVEQQFRLPNTCRDR